MRVEGGLPVALAIELVAEGEAKLEDVPSALILSPFSTTLMGPVAVDGAVGELLLVFGLFFWPVWAWIGWHFIHGRTPMWATVFLFVWTLQAYWGSIGRMHAMMSV